MSCDIIGASHASSVSPSDINGGRSSEPEAAVIESSNGGRDSPAGCGHEHFAMKIVDETFNIEIDEVFTMLFSDSQLFRDFIKRRRTYGKPSSVFLSRAHLLYMACCKELTPFNCICCIL